MAFSLRAWSIGTWRPGPEFYKGGLTPAEGWEEFWRSGWEFQELRPGSYRLDNKGDPSPAWFIVLRPEGVDPNEE